MSNLHQQPTPSTGATYSFYSSNLHLHEQPTVTTYTYRSNQQEQPTGETGTYTYMSTVHE